VVKENGKKNSEQFLSSYFFQKKNTKLIPPRGQGGPPMFFLPEILHFFELKPPAKKNDNPFWEKSMWRRKEKTRKIMTNIVDTSLCCNT
jgi:hypothetical protein